MEWSSKRKTSYWMRMVSLQTLQMLFLLLAFAGSICSLLGLRNLLAAALFGAALILAAQLIPFFTLRLRNRFLLLLVPAAVFAAGAMRTIRGFQLAANRIFAASEAEQAYLYEKYDVEVSAGGETLAMFYMLTAAFLLLACILVLLEKHLWICSVVIGCAAAAFISYFGIVPSLVWMGLLLAACLAPILSVSEQGMIAYRRILPVLGFVLAVSLAAMVLPQESTAISEADDALRDKIAMHTVQYADEYGVNGISPQTEEEQEEADEEAEGMTDDGIDLTRYKVLAGLILLILLILFVPAVISDRLRRKTERLREGMDDADDSAAARAMVRYAMRWLKAGGFGCGNTPFPDWRSTIGRSLPEAYLGKYDAAMDIWQGAAFGGRSVTEEQKRTVFEFLCLTEDEVWSRADLRQKARIRLQDTLRREARI